MSAHNLLSQLFLADFVQVSPSSSQNLALDRWFSVFRIVTAAAETRTLPRPHKDGLVCAIVLDTDGGDLTVTVTGGYNQAGTTSIVFGDAGDFVLLYSVKIGSGFYWRVLGSEGCGLAATVGDLAASSL